MTRSHIHGVDAGRAIAKIHGGQAQHQEQSDHRADQDCRLHRRLLVLGVYLILALLVATPAWAAFTVTRTETADIGSGHPTYTCNLPASIAAGDLLIVVLSGDTNVTAAAIGGFTELFDDDTSGGGAVLGVGAYKFAVGGETTVTITASGTADEIVCHAFRIQGAHASTPPEVNFAAAASSDVPDPPASPTASWGSDANLFLTVTAMSGAATIDAYPTNYTTNGDHIVQGSVGIASSWRTATAASDDPGAWDFSAAQSTLNSTWVIRPAAAANIAGPLVNGGQVKSLTGGSLAR